jgi:septal ring factor EnvC (AmiA/AmiB activator)
MLEWPWRTSRRDALSHKLANCEECERLQNSQLELEAELEACKSALAESEAKNAALEAKENALRAETERALADLVIARLSKGGRSAANDDKFKRLARTVQKFLHPDRAGPDPVLAAALGAIFQDLRAEIEAIEKTSPGD